MTTRQRTARIQWAPRRPITPHQRGVIERALLLPFVIAITATLVAVGLFPAFSSAGKAIKHFDHTFLGGSGTTIDIPPFPERSTIYAADGTALATVADQNRLYVTLKDIDKTARDAVLAIEDHGFYQHGAINVTSIIRAALANLKAGKIVQGGSTISQQLIKNTETGNAETFSRKFREAQDAIRLERTYTKDQILELYMNEIYLGNGTYGIASAAEFYFATTPDKLTLPLAALLAGMIAGPSAFDPIAHRADALARRNEVLLRMRDLNWITEQQYSQAVAAPIKMSSKKRNVNALGTQPYFVSYVMQQFLNDPRYGATLTERRRLLLQGGLKIYTTLDPRMQRDAERVLAQHLPHPGFTYPANPLGALATVVPKSGAIRVLASNTNFKKFQVNLAADARRSTGSAFKAFTLAAAMEQGVPPGRVYPTKSPLTIPNCAGTTYTLSNAEGPGNMGFMDLWQATADSVNVVFAQLIRDIGPQSVVDAAVAMGLPRSSMNGAYCSLTLGGGVGTNPLEMSSAYATLANGGIHCKAFAISRVVSRTGKSIFKAKPSCKQAIPIRVASQVTAMLEGVVTGGTGTAASLSPRPVAGKTGTGQDYQDAWFMGYVPQLSTGVWVGYKQEDAMRAMPILGGANAFGGTIAAPIWHDYMAQALAGMPIKGFPTPPPQRSGTIPNVVGLDQQRALDALAKANFVGIVQMKPSNKPKGIVFQQSPTGGSVRPLGSAVTIFVSTGKAPKPVKARVPPVVGMKEPHAAATLHAAGFGVNVQYQQVTDAKLDGRVLAQSPLGGTNAVPGSTVVITVGKLGPSPSPSPSGSHLSVARGGGATSGGSIPIGAWFAPGLLLGWTTRLAMARRRHR
jgi:penicillin-binding protein 1A